MNKMIFICTALGYQKNFIAQQVESIFKIPQSEKRLYFGMGTPRVDSPAQPWDNVKATIDEHLKLFPNRTMIYHGWEILEFFEELRAEYPHGQFYGIRMDEAFTENMIVDWIHNSYDVNLDIAAMRNRIVKHHEILDNLWNNQDAVINDTRYTAKHRKCFFIK